MSEIIERLRDVVSKATPGPWWNSGERDAFGGSEHFVADKSEGREVCSYFSDPDNVDDAVHIATFDPVLVAAMLDVIDAVLDIAPGYDGHQGPYLDGVRADEMQAVNDALARFQKATTK